MWRPAAVTLAVPVRARVVRNSLRRISSARVTPASPAAASAKRKDLPIRPARAPKRQGLGDVLAGADAAVEQHLATAADRLDDLWASTEIVEGAPSSCRPP